MQKRDQRLPESPTTKGQLKRPGTRTCPRSADAVGCGTAMVFKGRSAALTHTSRTNRRRTIGCSSEANCSAAYRVVVLFPFVGPFVAVQSSREGFPLQLDAK